jgi:hypothetical protein
MEIFIVILFIGYSVYKDFLFYKEREKLQMKFMSKNLTDYVSNTTATEENTKQNEDPFLPIEDASIEQILKTKDRT